MYEERYRRGREREEVEKGIEKVEKEKRWRKGRENV